MNYIYDDGGRAEAGFSGQAGDCVVRAICIASGLSYTYVYDAMATGMQEQRRSRADLQGIRRGRKPRSTSPRHGVTTSRKWFKEWMRAHGFRWIPTMQIGTGCKVHLRAEELPSGRLVAVVSRHYTAVIDRVVHDLYDPSREGTRCVYGYWIYTGRLYPSRDD